MKDKDLLMKAIDNYDGFNTSYRKVLKILIDLSVDEIVVTSVIKLSKLSDLSRTLIYQILEALTNLEFIEITRKKDKGRLNNIILKSNKLKEIIRHYELEQEATKKYIKNVE